MAYEEVPPILWLALLLFSFAFVYVARVLLEAMLGPIISAVNSIPILGGDIAGFLRSIERRVLGALGSAEHAIDKEIGASFHAFVKLNVWLWHEFVQHAHTLVSIASYLPGIGLAVRAIQQAVHALHHTATHHDHRLKALEKEYHGIDKELRVIQRELAKGIGNDVRIHVKALQHELDKIEHSTIPKINSDVATVEGDVTQLGRWIAGSFPIPRALTFAGAVAIALSSLGLGGLRCSNFLNLLRKHGCGLGSLLESLLGLAISALALENVCRLLPILEAAFGEVVGPVIHLLTEVPLGDCEKPPDGWARLSVAPGPLPPAQTLGALPV